MAKFILILVLFGPLCTYGEELPEAFYAVRPAGMGGAFTAVADDPNSVWTNPAGISRIRKARARSKVHMVSFPNAVVGGNQQGLAFYAKVQAAKSANSKSTLADNVKSAAATFNSDQSKPI